MARHTPAAMWKTAIDATFTPPQIEVSQEIIEQSEREAAKYEDLSA